MLALMSDKKLELRNKNTITEIFDFLTTECTFFLNYDIFLKIHENYNISKDQNIMSTSRLILKNSEFAKINPLLKSKSGSKELTLK